MITNEQPDPEVKMLQKTSLKTPKFGFMGLKYLGRFVVKVTKMIKNRITKKKEKEQSPLEASANTTKAAKKQPVKLEAAKEKAPVVKNIATKTNRNLFQFLYKLGTNFMKVDLLKSIKTLGISATSSQRRIKSAEVKTVKAAKQQSVAKVKKLSFSTVKKEAISKSNKINQLSKNNQLTRRPSLQRS